MNHIRPSLDGDNLVRLIYLDEAGISNPAHEPYLVVAGVIIHGDRQWKALDEDLWNLVCKYIPENDRKGFVFHAYELFSGGKYFNRETWPREKRWEILDAIIGLIEKYKIPIVHGYVDRAAFKKTAEEVLPKNDWGRINLSQMMHGAAFTECARRAQEWMEIYGGSEVGIFIAEDTPQVKRFIKAIHAELRNPASAIFQIKKLPLGPLLKIIDTIHFAQKTETSILQIADVCAFIFKRALMKNEGINHEAIKRFYPIILASTLWPDERREKLEALLKKDGLSSEERSV